MKTQPFALYCSGFMFVAAGVVMDMTGYDRTIAVFTMFCGLVIMIASVSIAARRGSFESISYFY